MRYRLYSNYIKHTVIWHWNLYAIGFWYATPCPRNSLLPRHASGGWLLRRNVDLTSVHPQWSRNSGRRARKRRTRWLNCSRTQTGTRSGVQVIPSHRLPLFVIYKYYALFFPRSYSLPSWNWSFARRWRSRSHAMRAGIANLNWRMSWSGARRVPNSGGQLFLIDLLYKNM